MTILTCPRGFVITFKSISGIVFSSPLNSFDSNNLTMGCKTSCRSLWAMNIDAIDPLKFKNVQSTFAIQAQTSKLGAVLVIFNTSIFKSILNLCHTSEVLFRSSHIM